MGKSGKIVRYTECSWLLAVVFCMQFVVSFFIEKIFGEITNQYVYVVLTQLFAIILPSFLVCVFNGANIKKTFRLKKIGFARAVGCLALGISLQPVAIVLNMLLQRVVPMAPSSVVSQPETIGQVVVMAVVICIIPAISEELLVRGMVLTSIKSKGYFFSIFATSLIFAILHGDFISLPGYIILGAAAAFGVINSKSVFAGMLIHMSFNFSGVILDYLLGRYYTPGGFFGTESFFMVSGVVGAVMSMLFLWQLNNKKVKKQPTTEFFKNVWEVFFNLPFVIIFITYIIYIVL